MTDEARKIEDEQAARWNGPVGRAWVDAQELLDQLFKPFEHLLVDAVVARRRDGVLDVGCGTGSTTLAVARRLGEKGRCVGIDISEPMLDAARARAEREGIPARFIRADAQTHAFEPASVDMIVSRFGVMFFDDSVRAFANLRRAARDTAELRFVAWRSGRGKPVHDDRRACCGATFAGHSVRRPDGPGQFAFADRRRVSHILEESGWAEIDIRPVDVLCIFPEKELIAYLTRLGPVGQILQQTDEPTRTRVIETVRAAFEPYVHGSEVRFNAACWMVGARAPSS